MYCYQSLFRSGVVVRRNKLGAFRTFLRTAQEFVPLMRLIDIEHETHEKKLTEFAGYARMISFNWKEWAYAEI